VIPLYTENELSGSIEVQTPTAEGTGLANFEPVNMRSLTNSLVGDDEQATSSQIIMPPHLTGAVRKQNSFGITTTDKEVKQSEDGWKKILH